MEKPTLYIETSIVGYLAAEQSRDIITAARQEITREWWNTRRSRFRLFTSEFTVGETEEGNPEASGRRARMLDGMDELDLTGNVRPLAESWWTRDRFQRRPRSMLYTSLFLPRTKWTTY